MTLVPLSKVQCDLAKTRKYSIDVPGTANISYGHKLRERESWHAAKYRSGSRRSLFGSTEESSEEDKREYKQFLKTLDFEKETNRKIRNKNLRQRVQQGINEDADDDTILDYVCTS